MVVIRIQERGASGREDVGQENGVEEMEAVVVFDHGVEYAARVCDPFGEEAEKEGDLEWHFEQYLTFPFTQKVRKERTEGSIREYGEALFGQVFAGERARPAYREARQREGVYGLRFEIVGSARFHRLHWEALYDAELGEPTGCLALSAVMVRKNVLQPRVEVLKRTAKTINVLVVVARPNGRRDVAYRTISRPLVDLIEELELPVEVTLLRPGTYMALQEHLERVSRARGVGYYQVVHFDAHGGLLGYEEFCEVGEGEKRESLGNVVVYKVKRPRGLPEIKPYEGKRAFLSLEREDEERSGLVEAEEVGRLLTLHQVPVAILNACQSAKYVGGTDSSLGSRLVRAGVQTVVAMGYSITVSAAELLMKALYEELFRRRRLAEALSVARKELANDKERRAYYNQRIELEDWLLPIVYQNQEVGFETQAMEWGEQKAFWQG